MTRPQPPGDGTTEAPAFEQQLEQHTLPPEDVFSILGHRTRLSILRVLWDADDTSLPFAEIKRRVPLDTQNFDYHLKQLVGYFVRHADDGYALRHAGEQVMRAMVSGIFTDDSSLVPVEIESRCPFCGAPVELQYQDEHLIVRCTDCGGATRDGDHPTGTVMDFHFPPSGLSNRSPSDVLETAHVLYDSKLAPMMEGVCPECAATVANSFSACEDHELDEDGLCAGCDTRFAVWVEFTCEQCGYRRVSPPWFKLLTEPAVIAFYYEHSDFDRSVPFSKLTWQNAPYVRSIVQSVVSVEPFRIRIDVPVSDQVLTATLDDDLEIVELERRRRSEHHPDGATPPLSGNQDPPR